MQNDHFVTRAFLDRFIHPTTKASGQNILYPYAKGTGACKPRGTKRLGCAEDFYRLRTLQSESERYVDEYLTKLDAYYFRSGKRTCGPFASVVFSGKWPLSASDKLELAECLLMMRFRAPVQIHNAAMYSNLLDHVWAFNLLGREDFKQVLLRDGCTEEEYDAGRKGFIKGDVTLGVEEGGEKHLGLTPLEFVPQMSGAVAQLRWRLIVASINEFFLTGDNPVVIDVPEDKFGQGLLQSPNTEIWFPISHDLGFLIDHRPGPDIKERVGHSRVRMLNRRILRWAYKFIYSPLSESWIEYAAINETFNPLRGRLESIQSLLDSADGDFVDMLGYLQTSKAVPADIFSDMQLH